MLSKRDILKIVFCIFCLTYAEATTSKSLVKKVDLSDNRGNTPFFLQDPFDEMCLGPRGFGMCDESTLWILTKRKGKSTYSLVSLLNPQGQGTCLQRKVSLFGLIRNDKVGIGSCGKRNAKSWSFEFVDQLHVKLSTQGQCLIRGKHYKNSISVQSCKKGEFVPLVYHPTAVHEHGFLIKTPDNYCFDGGKFTSCTLTSATQANLLWGMGVKYVWSGASSRYLFNIMGDRNECLVSRGGNTAVSRGACTDSGALGWNIANGQLSSSNGKHCLARLADNSAVLALCSEASEFVTLEVPPSTFLPGLDSLGSSGSSSSNSRSTVSGWTL